MENDGLWPYPQIDAVATAAIVVDRGGSRLLDEGLGGISITNDLARLDDPLCATVICDAAIWETRRPGGADPAQPAARAGRRHPAPGRHDRGTRAAWRALRPILALPWRPITRRFATGALAALSPPRSTKSGAPRPIETAPFYAIPICAGITNTMGGIAIDGHGRVRRHDGSMIDGLYAAGGCTGGLEGGGALGYVGGLIKACVFGLRAAEDIARRLRPGAA